MKKDIEDFFKEKKPWSEVKDELLSCYLEPYFSKIIQTHKPVNYIDCFAGRGKFEDGKNGSPVIALQALKKSLQLSTFKEATTKSYFIEPIYTQKLIENLKEFSNKEIIKGTYSDNIKDILTKTKGENIFLYIDPFGVKCLPFSLFKFYNEKNFSSIEVLLNFNSFGFIRLACKIMKAEKSLIEKLDTILKEGVIDESFIDDNSIINSIDAEKELSEIAGGDYWQEIISNLQNKKIDCYAAEKLISKEYCNKLKNHFKYVVDMPIRLKLGNIPKYRMIHATNNEDGCLLMVQNICKRWELLGDIQSKKSGGERSLFEETPENEIIDETKTQQMILDYLKRYPIFISMSKFLSEMFNNLGIFTDWKSLHEGLKSLETQNKIEIKRNPYITKTGKKSSFIFENRKNNQSVEIRIK